MKRWWVGMVLVLASQAVAQKPLLDLSAAQGAPAAGEGRGTLALAESLGADSQGIEKAGTVEAQVRAELRRLARELLASGEKAGQAGSSRIVLGRTIVNNLPELDKVVVAVREDPALYAVASDLGAARKRLEEPNCDVDVVLRDGLALLSKLAGTVEGVRGWVDEKPGPVVEDFGGKVEGWSKLPGVSEEAVGALRALEGLASDPELLPALARSAARARGLVADAGVAIEAPSWLAEATRRALEEQFSKGVTGLVKAETRADALETLTRLGAMARVIKKVDALEDTPAGKRVQVAVGQLVSIPVVQADARTLETMGGLLDLAVARSKWPEEKLFIQKLRPLLRILSNTARQTEQRLIVGLPEVMRRPEAMTDPGVLAAITAHQQAISDVEGLIAVNAAFGVSGGAEPAADKPWQSAVNRVLKLGQDLAKADQKEAAMASLRALFETVKRCWRMPGEEELRRAVKEDAGKQAKDRTSVWAKLGGGREAALTAEITDRRAGWIFDWEKTFAGGSDGKRLETLRELMEVMRGAGPVVRLGEGYASLQAWPGWELSATSMAGLSAGVEEQIAAATGLVLSGDIGKGAEAVARIRKDFSAVLLAGELSREAARRGIAGARDGAGVLRELTAGGPIRGRSWMGRETEVLDDVCRYGEEVAALRKLGARDKAEALQRFVNARAGELPERVEDR